MKWNKLKLWIMRIWTIILIPLWLVSVIGMCIDHLAMALMYFLSGDILRAKWEIRDLKREFYP